MGAADDTQVEKANWHWRNSMRPVRFFAFDARAVIPFMVLLFYFRTSTLLIAIINTAIFWWLERKGLTYRASLRALRVWIIGNVRPGWLNYRHRKTVDFG